MKYITGIHALNLPCSLLTCGDWHTSALRWDDLSIAESDNSFFGEYGIEINKTIPFQKETWPVANHIRALLDLLLEQNFAVAQGMNEDFICNESYDKEIFSKVHKMVTLPFWEKIDAFMGKEYRTKWITYKKEVGL